MAFFLKTKVWQAGALDWWAMLGNEDVYLGTREFPLPPEEGDEDSNWDEQRPFVEMLQATADAAGVDLNHRYTHLCDALSVDCCGNIAIYISS